MKNLIIDLEKHFPSAERIFFPSDYFSPNLPLDEMRPLQPLPDSAYCKERYNIDAITDLENLDSSYDKIVIVWPVHSFNDFECTTNVQERRDFFIKIYNKLKNISYNQVLYFDGSDRAIVNCGLKWLQENNLDCDFIFKREYRKSFEYDYDKEIVFPFPFAVFGKPNPSFILYEERMEKNQPKVNDCFWAGTAILTSEYYDMVCDRASILNKIHPYLNIKSGLAHQDFIREIAKHKFFLNLNGTGHLCKRFFEGLSTGSLMMMQRTDLVFPFEDIDYFSEETLFTTSEEFITKLLILKQDDVLYKKCIDNQNYIVDKYFNYEWIRQYINSKINQKK